MFHLALVLALRMAAGMDLIFAKRLDSSIELVFSPLKNLIVGAALSVKRAVQVVLVGGIVFLWIVAPIIDIWAPIYLYLCTPFWWPFPLYLAWMWWDWDSPKRGARPFTFLRDNIGWEWLADYFPLRLVKTAELPPDRNYIVGSHPHGQYHFGGLATFLTEATGFSRLFPGITANLLTLEGQFWFPVRREFGLVVGGCDSSKSSLRWLLRNPGKARRPPPPGPLTVKGRAIGIVLGGLSESIMARPGRHDLKLKNRRGFCRFALQAGADLVPLYHFGENDLYDQELGFDEQRLKNMQARLRNIIGFCPPFPWGRSVLNFPWGGILPFRSSVTSVMGAPIRVEQADHPTDEEASIDILHSKYCSELHSLFENHKHLHNIPEHVHINFY